MPSRTAPNNAARIDTVRAARDLIGAAGVAQLTGLGLRDVQRIVQDGSRRRVTDEELERLRRALAEDMLPRLRRIARAAETLKDGTSLPEPPRPRRPVDARDAAAYRKLAHRGAAE
ncbi:hypothetical protein ACSMXM_01180 [Pacificimonas sp. ICDLI1SI03]